MPEGRFVETRYGPMPGCPECGVVVLGDKPLLCEHGVAPPITVELSLDFTFEEWQLDIMRRWFFGEGLGT